MKLIALLVLLSSAAYAGEMEDVKASVDDRGTYKYYQLNMKYANPRKGEFEGNCSIFAVTYLDAAKQVGFDGRTMIVRRDRLGGTSQGSYHAVAVITDKQGQQWVLDNAIYDVPKLEDYLITRTEQ